jgi:hypothetical protein
MTQLDADQPTTETPYDPLKLCVYATVAGLSWLLGPYAVVGFATLGIVGYGKARQAGLLTSKCALRDTRVVIAYLVLVALAGAVGILYQLGA